jgi:hypothetical protein
VGATNVVSIPAGASLQSYFNAAKPGDILELAAGTYPEPNYPGIEVSGTATNWIVVRGAAGTRPKIDLQSGGELHIGGSYVLFQNIEVVNGNGNNIHVTPTTKPVTNVILRDVLSHNMATGVGAALKVAGVWNGATFEPLDGLYVESSEFAGSLSNAVVDAVAVRHAVVRDCYLHDPVNGSLTCPGIFFKGGSNNILIERNLIRGIRSNAAIMIGGDTGASFFDSLYMNPKVEGVNEVVRNNVLADFDDSAFEVRGTHGAKIYNNTVVAQTSFCIFRLTWGGAGSGTQVGNYDIDMANNLVLAYGSPVFAQNNGNTDATLTFGPQLWGGSLSQGSGAGIPTFPQAKDVHVGSGTFGAVVVNPSYTSITGLPDALSRYPLASGSVAKGAGEANTVAPADITGKTRSTTTPSIGAFE